MIQATTTHTQVKWIIYPYSYYPYGNTWRLINHDPRHFNAFPTAQNSEKVWAVAGDEFDNLKYNAHFMDWQDKYIYH